MYLILYLHDVHYRRQALNFFISHFEVQIPKNFPLICKNLKSNGEKLFQIFYPNCNQLTSGVHFVVKRVSIELRAWIFSKCLAYIHYFTTILLYVVAFIGTYVAILDAFFHQIKSCRRFHLAFGFGLQTFYLIDFS